MKSRQAIRVRVVPVFILAGLVAWWCVFTPAERNAEATESSGMSVQEQREGLLKNAEEMVAHGGMGDAKAIVHHCGEAARHAEALIKYLSTSESRGDETVKLLNEVIRQCRRVSDIGVHADPGQLLNPAIKARAAARDSAKALAKQ